MVTVIKKGSSAKKVLEKVEKLKKDKENKGISRLCGNTKLKSDPLKLQKQWRYEWK